MNIQKVVIIALSVDPTQITLWKEDGSTVCIKQGDPRVARIVEEAKAKGLSQGNPVEVDLAYSVITKPEYLAVEEGSKGVMRFLRIARDKLASFFKDEDAKQPPKPVSLVPSIDMGLPITPRDKLVNNAVATTIAVQLSAPASYVEQAEEHRDQSLYITGMAKNVDMKSLFDVVHRISGNGDRSTTMELLNGNLPILLDNSLQELAAKLYAEQINAVFGVKATYQHYRLNTPEVYHFPAAEKDKESNSSKLKAATQRLEALDAVTSDKPEFHAPLKDDETIVAVVGDKVIPDVQALQRQIRQSAKLKDYKGFTKFLERLSNVISERRHSVEDLMKFMEKGDLPIADDGSIVIYKRLNISSNTKHFPEGVPVYKDVHSGNIHQAVGTLVRVDDHLVDQNRRQDCSNGLHVASLSYLSSFGGSVTIIGKVPPEKVFAVPEYNINKMRVGEYHIVDVLPEEMRKVVNDGGSITSVKGGVELLNKVLTGNHPSPNVLVTVSGHMGTKLNYTQLDGAKTEVVVTKTKSTIDLKEDLTGMAMVAEPIKATDLKPAATVAAPAKKGTNMEQVAVLWADFQKETDPELKAMFADEIVAIKGRVKKSYDALGVTKEMLEQLIASRAVKPVPDKSAPKASPAKKSKPAATSNIGTQIREILNDDGRSGFSKAQAMHDLKRAAKKSYSALGLSADEIKQIDKLKHHLK